MIQNGQVFLDCGYNIDTFDEKKLLDNYDKIKFHDFQGSTWAPSLVHKDIWGKVGGFSEEFSPGLGSDPDFNLKLWNIEDGKRLAEKKNEFGKEFIELARNVYKFNDERAKIKLAINNALGSNIKEVKSYE